MNSSLKYDTLAKECRWGDAENHVVIKDLFQQNICKYIQPKKTNRLFDLIRSAMRRCQPFLLIRLADGEGEFLAGSNRELVGAVHCKKQSYVIDDDEFEVFKQQTLDACDNTEVLGAPREDMMTPRVTHIISGLRADTATQAFNVINSGNLQRNEEFLDARS